jgi:hypothetical protein
MSDVKDRDNHSSDSGGAANAETRNADNQLPPLRPIRFFKRRFRLAQRKEAKENKTNRYSQMPDANIAPMFDWLDTIWRRGAQLGSQGWIAMFTFVLTVATVGSFWEMYVQNNIMRAQMDQTDKTLAQMRLEQRPWLGVHQPEMDPIEADKQIVCKVPIKNSGHTPGNIVSAAVLVIALPSSVEMARVFDRLETVEPMNLREAVIPPDGTVHFFIEDAPTLSQKHIDDVNAGKIRVWIIGRFTYSDVTGKRHSTRLSYLYDPKTKVPIGTDKNNYMD